MQRDELGRFTKGNQIAKGNKGNTSPKYGNMNALKHGFYARTYNYNIEEQPDSSILLNNGINQVVITQEQYKKVDDRIYIRDDIAEQLEKKGYGLVNNRNDPIEW